MLLVCLSVLLLGAFKAVQSQDESNLTATLEEVFPDVIPLLKFGTDFKTSPHYVPSRTQSSPSDETVLFSNRRERRMAARPRKATPDRCLQIRKESLTSLKEKSNPAPMAPREKHEQVEVKYVPAHIPYPMQQDYSPRYRRAVASLTRFAGLNCPCALEGQDCQSGLVCRNHICVGKCAETACEKTITITIDPIVIHETKDSSSRDPSPKDPSPRDPSPRDPSPRDPSPRDLVSKDPTPKDPNPKDPTPKDPTPKDPTPKDPTPKDPTPKDPTPKDPTPKDPTPKDPTPKDPTPKDPTPKDPPPKGDSGKVCRASSRVVEEKEGGFEPYTTSAFSMKQKPCGPINCKLSLLGTYEVGKDLKSGPLLQTYPQFASGINSEGKIKIDSFPGNIPWSKRAIVQRYKLLCFETTIDATCRKSQTPVNVPELPIILIPDDPKPTLPCTKW